MPNPRRCVFTDVEATGLDPHHQVTEAAYYDLSTGERGVFIPPHTLDGAEDIALELSGYHTRIAGQPFDDGTHMRRFHSLLGGDGVKTTLIAANPSYDVPKIEAMFLRSGITPAAPWHHRKMDISQMTYDLFPDRFPEGELPGLAQVAELLRVPIPQHHDALQDVLVGVECYRRLARLRQTVKITLIPEMAA